MRWWIQRNVTTSQQTRSMQPIVISIRPKQQDQTNPSKIPAQSGPGLHLPADKHHQQIVGGDQSPSRMESSRHQADTKRREGPRDDGEPSRRPERLVTNHLRYFAESMHVLIEYQTGFRHSRSTEDQLL